MVIDPLVLIGLNTPAYCVVGWVIYGDWPEFVQHLRAWVSRVFSLEIFDGAIIPTSFRLQLCIYLSAAFVWGEYCLLR